MEEKQTASSLKIKIDYFKTSLYWALLLCLILFTSSFSQLDRMEGPSMEVSPTTIENDKKLNKKYQTKYQQAKREFGELVKEYQTKGTLIKWLLLIGWLLPALAVGTNAFKFKLIKWGGPAAILIGTTLTGSARYLFEADEKTYRLAALDVEAILNDWTHLFSDVEDNPNYFSDPGTLAHFKEELNKRKLEITQIKRRLANQQSAAPSLEDNASSWDFDLIPAAHAQPLVTPPSSRRSTSIAHIGNAKIPKVFLEEETLHLGNKKFPLKGLYRKIGVHDNMLLVAGVGAGETYQLAKDRGGVSLRESFLHKVLYDIPLLSTMKDTLLAYLIAEQTTDYFLKNPIYENLLLDSQYVFVSIASASITKIKEAIEEMMDDSGLKLNLDRMVLTNALNKNMITIPNGPFNKVREKRSMLQLKNTTSPTTGAGNSKFYNFNVYLEDVNNALVDVDSVVYHFHRTFTNRNITLSNKADAFSYNWRGWGTFTMSADVYFNDNTQMILFHKLQFTH